MGKTIIPFLDTECLYCEEDKSWDEILFHQGFSVQFAVALSHTGIYFLQDILNWHAITIYILNRCQIQEIMSSLKLGLAHLFQFSSQNKNKEVEKR